MLGCCARGYRSDAHKNAPKVKILIEIAYSKLKTFLIQSLKNVNVKTRVNPFV
jgi:hypothetical protein